MSLLFSRIGMLSTTLIVLSLMGTAQAVSIPEQLPDQRADKLILKTMNQPEMLQFILDSCEDALDEFEPAWIQETPTSGYWKLPHHLYSGVLANKPYEEGLVALTAYFLLYFERDKPLYAGKYSRDLLLKRMRDFRNGHPTIIGYLDASVMDPMIQSGVWKVPSLGIKTPATTAERDALYATILTKRIDKALDIQADTEAPQPAANFYFYDNPSVTGIIDYHRWMYHGLLYYSRQQDRAVNWVEVDRGHALSEVRQNGTEKFFSNCTSPTHQQYLWTYFGAELDITKMLYKAAIKGRGTDQVPPPYRETADSNLSSTFLGFVRNGLRNQISPDGYFTFPTGDGGDKHFEMIHMAYFLTVDASVNKNPESTAYLSRALQSLMWLVRRPHAPTYYHGGYATHAACPAAVFHIYYMLKHWGVSTELPSWEEVQARDGGSTYFMNADLTVHRNPFKYIDVRVGALPKAETLLRDTFKHPHCQFVSNPWKDGHGMRFSRLAPATISHFTSNHFTGAYGPELVTFYQSDKWKVQGTSIFGTYKRNPEGAWWVKTATRSFSRSDDGLNVAFEHDNSNTTQIKRALFSLGGRTTAIIEQSPTIAGEFAPIQLSVADMYFTSQRAGWFPKVSWKIHMSSNQVVSVSDFQSTTNFQSATINPSTRWYNIEDRVAVVLPQPAPLILGCDQFPQVRDTISFGPLKGGSAIVYAGVETKDMETLSAEVKEITGLPTGWKGIQGKAPEGYRVYAIAKFSGSTTNWNFLGKEAEGAPVFSAPTLLREGFGGQATSEAMFSLPSAIDKWSEEPHFFVTDLQGGGTVTAKANYHRLELSAQGASAQVTVKFFGGKTSGTLTVEGTANWTGIAEAASIRSQGMTINLQANQSVWLAVKETGSLYDDRVGPYVHITSPKDYYMSTNNVSFGKWVPISGAYTFTADAGDRSGVDRVEFYLNKNQLIGVDATAPYECTYEIKKTYSQRVYAVAYDKMGNSRRSFEIPFGDGTVRPLDADQDEMSDSWEKTYALNPFSASDAGADNDGDGFNNLQEFSTKTNPVLSSSRLKLDSIQTLGNSFEFSFPSQNGVIYGVECCDDLKLGNWGILTNGMVGDGGDFSFTDPAAGSLTKRFYRLRSY